MWGSPRIYPWSPTFFIVYQRFRNNFKTANIYSLRGRLKLICRGYKFTELTIYYKFRNAKSYELAELQPIIFKHKKLHIMVFGQLSEQMKKQVAITINGHKLDVVDKTKFLGLVLDNSLTWKPHISYLTQKLSKSIGILAQARKILDCKTLIQLYYSFIIISIHKLL